METSKELDLKITTEDTLSQDHPNDTIVEYGKNFLKLEEILGTSVSNIESLETNKTYPIGHIIWNNKPKFGGFVGWVNLREGLHVNPKKSNTNYNVGDRVSSPNDTGFYYECIRAGTTPNKMSQTMGTVTNAFNEVSDVARWNSGWNYSVDDIVFATSHDQNFFLQCTKAGLSGQAEPTWTNHTNGTTITDGTVTWKKLGNPRWQRMGANSQFAVFGKIGEGM